MPCLKACGQARGTSEGPCHVQLLADVVAQVKCLHMKHSKQWKLCVRAWHAASEICTGVLSVMVTAATLGTKENCKLGSGACKRKGSGSDECPELEVEAG